jgi:hypothetical protein
VYFRRGEAWSLATSVSVKVGAGVCLSDLRCEAELSRDYVIFATSRRAVLSQSG